MPRTQSGAFSAAPAYRHCNLSSWTFPFTAVARCQSLLEETFARSCFVLSACVPCVWFTRTVGRQKVRLLPLVGAMGRFLVFGFRTATVAPGDATSVKRIFQMRMNGRRFSVSFRFSTQYRFLIAASLYSCRDRLTSPLIFSRPLNAYHDSLSEQIGYTYKVKCTNDKRRPCWGEKYLKKKNTHVQPG